MLIANKISEKRGRGIGAGQSQSAMDNSDNRGVAINLIQKHDSQPRMANSPSLKHLDQMNVQGLQSSSKKRPLVNGQSHAVLAGSGGANGMQNGSNYIRIVNIYSVNNYKNKRKSHAPQQRINLNHSILPAHGQQGKIGTYDESRRHGSSDIQLPEIRAGSQAYGEVRGYAYKSGID